ncbi:HD domain-containing protein [Terasakiella sp. A23]|uniref:HD-GYP domain-containing protein n=1 Tax=Terasakiella sp. FCG-A23 TaxID=3080561 RepID=UPI002955CAB4|nr:HD domain-containing phosphohydrolase [Terasakiella sp. A23]MDV7340553.1 HD domain-containing protein [Terasakiella sp. A23]
MLQKVLNKDQISIGERLCQIHEEIRITHPALCRIAVAVYDRETDKLKTFAHSTDGSSPISFYEAPLAQAKSLQEIAEDAQPRIIDDLSVFSQSTPHTANLIEHGYLASMTVPIRFNGQLYGFLFFNSAEKGYFSDGRLASLKAYAGVVSLLIINELQTLRTFKGAVKTAREFSRQRDEETGNHLERMSRYARLIARDLAPKYNHEEDWIEYIFQFAPLHDVGKVAVPDDILLKPGKLTMEEYELMKSHVVKGGDIISVMAEQFGLSALNFFDMLRNIVMYHHEALDGTGYPHGLKGGEIPLESRIVAVADIFDALTSKRPYKDGWSNDRAMKTLQIEAGVRLDKECVESLASHMIEIEAIQQEFGEDFMG